MSKNAYADAKSAALELLNEAAALDTSIKAALEAAMSAAQMNELHGLCSARLQLHDKLATALRQLDQCLHRRPTDPVHDGLLRGEADGLVTELFSVVSEDALGHEDCRIPGLQSAAAPSPEARTAVENIVQTLWPVVRRKHQLAANVSPPAGIFEALLAMLAARPGQVVVDPLYVRDCPSVARLCETAMDEAHIGRLERELADRTVTPDYP